MEKKTTGIVLLNLGGPDSLQAVRPFLYNLFSDRDIIRLGPAILQKPIARLISGLRSNKTKGMYALIGGKSPILDITSAQANALEEMLNQNTEHIIQNTPPASTLVMGDFKVYIGMRYWRPFIKDTFQRIVDDGIKHLIVLSLYPHYSKATTGSAVAEFKRIISNASAAHPSLLTGESNGRGIVNIQYIEHWYDFPAYIDSLAGLIAEGVSDFEGNNFDILYSAHSLPDSFIREGDPYLDHIKTTIEKVHERLSGSPYKIAVPEWHLSFQSKTGPVRWLEPSTEETIINLAKKGCTNLFVVPVSFVSDHIETLYEIDILYKALAEKHGINLVRCKSLNTNEKFIHALKELIMSNIKQERIQGIIS